jgi:hypothetical protein
MQEEGVEDVDAEQERINSEDFSNNARRRIGEETDEIRNRLENGEDLTARPRPRDVPLGERRRAREAPPIR